MGHVLCDAGPAVPSGRASTQPPPSPRGPAASGADGARLWVRHPGPWALGGLEVLCGGPAGNLGVCSVSEDQPCICGSLQGGRGRTDKHIFEFADSRRLPFSGWGKKKKASRQTFVSTVKTGFYA